MDIKKKQRKSKSVKHFLRCKTTKLFALKKAPASHLKKAGALIKNLIGLSYVMSQKRGTAISYL
jgi:hypothetical protein